MLMGIGFQLCSLLAVLLIHGPIGCFVAMLFAGCVGGTLLVSYTNLLVESCPHQVRVAHLMIGNMIVGFAGLLLPVVGARIATYAGIPVLIEVSFVLSAVALVWSICKLRDPRGPKKPAADEFPAIVPYVR
jgi:MFS family permease